MGKKKNKFSFNSSDVILYIWRKRNIFLFVIVIAFISSAIVSYTITPKFKSTVVMFPASSASVSGTLLTESAFSTNELLKFGGEQEAEQLMQVLHSGEIRSRIMKKYNLARHYKIDSTSGSFYHRLNSTYDSNIKFRRTEFMSIIAEVMDTDPDTAAYIANDIAFFVDTVMNQIVHERAVKALAIVDREYNELNNKIEKLQDSLVIIRQIGVLNYDAQSQALSNAYADAIKNGNTGAAQKLESKLAILAKFGGNYVSIRELLTKYNDRLAILSAKYQQAKVDVEQNLPYKYVIEKAYPSDIKAYPVRSLIVLVSVFSAFFMALVILIIRDSIFKSKD